MFDCLSISSLNLNVCVVLHVSRLYSFFRFLHCFSDMALCFSMFLWSFAAPLLPPACFVCLWQFSVKIPASLTQLDVISSSFSVLHFNLSGEERPHLVMVHVPGSSCLTGSRMSGVENSMRFSCFCFLGSFRG